MIEGFGIGLIMVFNIKYLEFARAESRRQPQFQKNEANVEVP